MSGSLTLGRYQGGPWGAGHPYDFYTELYIMADVQLDCQGLNCPIPLVRISQTMKTMQAGQTLEVTADDPAFSADVRAWVTKMGHTLLTLDEEGVQRAVICKVTPGQKGTA